LRGDKLKYIIKCLDENDILIKIIEIEAENSYIADRKVGRLVDNDSDYKDIYSWTILNEQENKNENI